MRRRALGAEEGSAQAHETSLCDNRVAALTRSDLRLTSVAANREEKRPTDRRKRDLCSCYDNSQHRAHNLKIFCLVFSVLLLLSYNTALACDDVSETQTYPSPSSEAEAALNSRFCATDIADKVYTVTLKNHNSSKEIYQTWVVPPEVVWRSTKELVITVRLPSTIATSEHSFSDITISYRAELTEDYLRVLDKAKQAIYLDKKSFDPNMVSYLGIIDSFLAFKKWADANTEYENFR